MQSLIQITLVVDDYDDALAFYVGKLGFQLLEDTQLDEYKRWVVISCGEGAALLLAKAEGEQQQAVGHQTGGRVGFFLGTDNFGRDYKAYCSMGVIFVREPETSEYGTVAVFQDLYGNLWDLIEHRPGHRFALRQPNEY
ncbi:MAG: catechol 2,3-dioxygenase-like lactoylglutathione lyase family enzyme [Candidatus Azotimanducaceae bacterium]|jgi:catechol 2,3-dioxygenase-like lactoylglutathione lyase family enzyme